MQPPGDVPSALAAASDAGAPTPWTAKEKLTLLSVIDRVGQNDWSTIAKQVKQHAEAFAAPSSPRPANFYTSKSCAAQYTLIEEEMPKCRRSRSAVGGGAVDESSLHQMISAVTMDVMREIRQEKEQIVAEHKRCRREIEQVCDGKVHPEQLAVMLQETIAHDRKQGIADDHPELVKWRQLLQERVWSFPDGASSSWASSRTERAATEPTPPPPPPEQLAARSNASTPALADDVIQDAFGQPTDDDIPLAAIVKREAESQPTPPEVIERAATESLDVAAEGSAATTSIEVAELPLVADKSPAKPPPASEGAAKSEDEPEKAAAMAESAGADESERPALRRDSPRAAAVTPTPTRSSRRASAVAASAAICTMTAVPLPSTRDLSVQISPLQLPLSLQPTTAKERTPRSGRASPAVKALPTAVPEGFESAIDYKLWKQRMLSILEAISSHRHANLFAVPVTESIAKGYSNVVKRPMDLSKLKRAIEAGQLTSTGEMRRQLLQMFANAVMYNSTGHDVNTAAREMAHDAMRTFREMLHADSDEKSAAEMAKVRHGRAPPPLLVSDAAALRLSVSPADNTAQHRTTKRATRTSLLAERHCP